MEILELWLAVLSRAFLSLLTQPFFYISIVVLLMLLFYRVRMERAMFTVKLSNWKFPMLISVVAGIAAAIVVSTIAGLLGFSVSIDTIYWLWGITLVLVMFKIRFLAVAYSAGVVILLHSGAKLLHEPNLVPFLHTIYESLMAIEVTGLLFIVALLHLVEALLVRLQGTRLASPVYIASKRGKIVGGYRIQAYWPIPLFLFMPVKSTASGAFIFDEMVGYPFFINLSAEAWLLLACPIMIGVTELSKSLAPIQAVKKLASQLFLFGVGLLLLSLATWWYAPLVPVAAIITLLSHEVISWITKLKESNQAPAFITQNDGVKILAIIERSPAEEIGLRAGEVIQKVNGERVQSVNEVFNAMSVNPAFCKLEVLDTTGEIKFVQRARFADEHHQLGIIFAPEEYAMHYEYDVQPSLFTLFGKGKLTTNRKSKVAVEQTHTTTV